MEHNQESESPLSATDKPKRGRTKKDKKEEDPKVVDLYADMMFDLVQKDYVLFAPKSTRGLKFDYPELASRERSAEFVDIGKYDMLFIWAWACSSSPFQNIEPREEKLRLCCMYAYPPDQCDRKAVAFKSFFPEEINRGIERMGRYSLAARVEEYVAIKIARENYKHILAQDISGSPVWAQKEWSEISLVAQKGLSQQRDRVEGFGLGVEEASNTLIGQAIDLLSMHHTQN